MSDYKDYSIKQLKSSYLHLNKNCEYLEVRIALLANKIHEHEKCYENLSTWDGTAGHLNILNSLREDYRQVDFALAEYNELKKKVLKELNKKRNARPISQDSLCLLE